MDTLMNVAGRSASLPRIIRPYPDDIANRIGESAVPVL